VNEVGGLSPGKDAADPEPSNLLASERVDPPAPRLTPLSAATERPRAPQPAREGSRNIPAHVKRAVWVRDGGRCTFRGPDGHRCESRSPEYDHIVPVARGGKSEVSNVRLLCRPHNQLEAERAYGVNFMESKRRAS
jgi:5-methylcytosine-specific restriction endonuclease McrA